ncbi:response regulator [Salinibius halmophilus]|uniref:response regulator n=1 Tax=Salinibius halmophilus TaxID=1853216 RepID=UPI0013149161|nr:response regulator [Salinibius halmophilus]
MTHVLIVDDAPDNRLILESMLKGDYQTSTADSGEQCLQFCQQQVPDVIVLDVEMPGMDGYQTCKALRLQPSTNTVPVLFVTGKDTDEERLAGYESGGNAYLIKPVEKDTLVDQIERSQLTRRAAAQAQKDADMAMNVAMEAMTSSSELGQIIEFVKQVQEASRRIDVANLLVDSLKNFGLNIAVYVPNAAEPFAGCMASSIEAQLLEKAVNKPGRILSFGIRTIVKSEVLVMLVKNMPVEEEAKYGRFKDHLAVMLTIAEGRMLAIQSSIEAKGEQIKLLDEVMVATASNVDSVRNAFEHHDEKVKTVMLDMITDLEAMLFRLGLDEDQEEKLMKLAYDANERLRSTEKSKTELLATTEKIMDGLAAIKQQLS